MQQADFVAYIILLALLFIDDVRYISVDYWISRSLS